MFHCRPGLEALHSCCERLRLVALPNIALAPWSYRYFGYGWRDESRVVGGVNFIKALFIRAHGDAFAAIPCVMLTLHVGLSCDYFDQLLLPWAANHRWGLFDGDPQQCCRQRYVGSGALITCVSKNRIVYYDCRCILCGFLLLFPASSLSSHWNDCCAGVKITMRRVSLNGPRFRVSMLVIFSLVEWYPLCSPVYAKDSERLSRATTQ